MRGKIVLAGGTGLIGKPLAFALEAAGYEVVLLVRRATSSPYKTVLWEGKALGPWQNELEGAAGVINLSGRSVSCRWSERNRRAIESSRVESTTAIGEAIAACTVPPPVWVNASGISYYGNRGDEPVDERSAVGTGFLADVCRFWEGALFSAPTPSTRRVALRTGPVLAAKGGLFPILRLLSRLGLGGSAGSGQQWISPIHIEDLTKMYVSALSQGSEGQGWEGPVNAVGPKPERNEEFMMVLRHEVGRDFGLRAPEWALKFMGGTTGPDESLILDSTRVLPQKATDLGFAFKFDRVETIFANLLRHAEHD